MKTISKILICSALGFSWLYGAEANGPLFTVKLPKSQSPVTVIDYGDMRFTDPSEKKATNPKVRQWLVAKIAEERPVALLLSGDVPWHGGHADDYAEYARETKAWRDAQIHVYPALGNHEFAQADKQECLTNWWNAFPELRDHRYYSAQVGAHIYVMNLNSNEPLTPGSEQIAWFDAQLERVPKSVRWVFINLHHPPVSDFQEHGDPSHNARPNEIALRDHLEQRAAAMRPRFIVIGGHVHNYERFQRGNIVYLVSGGGGADPRPIIRTPEDLYKTTDFPNYHYVKFVEENDALKATMVRVADPEGEMPKWEIRDQFEIPVSGK
jgi:acid phosphatase type 7